MITLIRKKLVIGYTLAIILIMFASFVISFFMLRHSVISTCKKSLISYLSEEITEAGPILEAWQKDHNIPADITTVVANQKAFNNVVYLYVPDGRLILAQELPAPVAAETREIIKNWKGRQNKIVYHSLSSISKSHPWQMLMMYRDIYKDGVFMGRVFVGTNLSPLIMIAHKYYKRVFFILLTFSILAYLIGNKLADRAIKPAIQAMNKQKEFVADASHELRTPLSVLLSSIDILKKTPDNPELIADMKDEILNMRQLVNDLLTIARSDNDKDNMLYSDFDLTETAESTIRLFKPQAAEKNITISSNIEKCIPVYADEVKIRQLLHILIDNAVKYSPNNTNIEIMVAKNNDNVVINVKDEGLGILPEHLDKIFERFYRIDKSRTRSTGGFGLGLPIAKIIAEKHGGTILVKSELGKGSSFIVNIPLNNEKA